MESIPMENPDGQLFGGNVCWGRAVGSFFFWVIFSFHGKRGFLCLRAVAPTEPAIFSNSWHLSLEKWLGSANASLLLAKGFQAQRCCSVFLLCEKLWDQVQEPALSLSLQPINCILVFDRRNLFRNRTLLGEVESEMFISHSGEPPTCWLSFGGKLYWNRARAQRKAHIVGAQIGTCSRRECVQREAELTQPLGSPHFCSYCSACPPRRTNTLLPFTAEISLATFIVLLCVILIPLLSLCCELPVPRLSCPSRAWTLRTWASLVSWPFPIPFPFPIPQPSQGPFMFYMKVCSLWNWRSAV